MAASPKLVLLMATWIILVLALFLVIILGADSLSSFRLVTDQFILSIGNVAESFVGLSETLITTIGTFVTLTTSVFASFATELGSGFLNIVAFLESSVAGIITEVLNVAGNSIETVGRAILSAGATIAGAFISVSAYLTSVNNSITQLLVDSTLWVSTFMVQLITQGIVFLINGLAEGIAFLENLLNEFVIGPIEQIINFLSNLDLGSILGDVGSIFGF